MSDKPSTFSCKDVKLLEEKCVFNGFFKMHEISLQHKLFAGGWSDPVAREVFHRGEACAAVLYDPKRDLIGLVEQFRIGALESCYGPWCIEVVAGMVEEGESPEQVIKRELEEEAGVKDAELTHITSYYSTPGGCSEMIHLYCAVCDLSNGGGIHGLECENEDIMLHIYPSEEVFAVMLKSRMNNAATLLGLQWLQLNRPKLRSELST